MSYRKFKKLVLKYFEAHSVVNKKLVKESLQFYDDSCLFQTYGVRFIFDDHHVILEYTTIRDKLNWELVEDNIGLYKLNYGAEVWNLGRTIEECCDYLWETK